MSWKQSCMSASLLYRVLQWLIRGGAVVSIISGATLPAQVLAAQFPEQAPVAPPRPEALPVFCEPYRGDVLILDDSDINIEFVQQPVQPRLNVAGPTYALWSGVNIAGPLYFFISTNYLSFIDRFELSIYRGGEATSGSPVKTFSGDVTTMMDPIAWNGELDTKGEIRPGETFHYILRVFDKLRNMDQTLARSFTVQRYLMPEQRAAFSKQRENLLGSFNIADHILYRHISSAGYPLRFRLKKQEASQSIGGIPVSQDMKKGFTQILLPGPYSFSLHHKKLKNIVVKGQCEHRLEIKAKTRMNEVPGEILLRVLRTAPVAYRRLGYTVDPQESYPVKKIGNTYYIMVKRTSTFAPWPTNKIAKVVAENTSEKPALETILDYQNQVFDLSKGARLFTLKDKDIREQSLQVIATGANTPVVLLRNIHYTYYPPKGWISLTESGEEYIGTEFQKIEVSYKASL